MKTLRCKEINKEKWQMENGLAESVDRRKERRGEDNRGKRYKMEDDGEKWWKQNPLSRVSFILPAEVNVWIQSPHTRYLSPVVSCWSESSRKTKWKWSRFICSCKTAVCCNCKIEFGQFCVLEFEALRGSSAPDVLQWSRAPADPTDGLQPDTELISQVT